MIELPDPVLAPLPARRTPPVASEAPVVWARGLAVRFGSVRALDGVDLSIGPGEVVALAGENGAGKTTLVRCMVGDIRPSSGRDPAIRAAAARRPDDCRQARRRARLAGPVAVREPRRRLQPAARQGAPQAAVL